MKARITILATMSVLAILAATAIFVWPTRFQILESEYGLLRMDRLTGETSMFDPKYGWRSTETNPQPVQVDFRFTDAAILIPDEELKKIELNPILPAKTSNSGFVKEIALSVYNGSAYEICRLEVRLSLIGASGHVSEAKVYSTGDLSNWIRPLSATSIALGAHMAIPEGQSLVAQIEKAYGFD